MIWRSVKRLLGNLSKTKLFVTICWTDVGQVCVFACRLSLESIQSETNALIKQLKNAEKKVLSSSEDVKEQFLSTIQVLQSSAPPAGGLLLLPSISFTILKSEAVSEITHYSLYSALHSEYAIL